MVTVGVYSHSWTYPSDEQVHTPRHFDFPHLPAFMRSSLFSQDKDNLSHTGVMDYDEACFMHLTLGVVHNFPKAMGV